MSVSCLTAIEKNMWPIVANSGRGLFKFGNYHGCLDSEGMNYFMIALGVPEGGSSGWSGVCLPKTCSADSIQIILNSLLKKYDIPLAVLSVTEDNQTSYPYDWLFFFTIILLMFLVIMVILSTFSKQIGKHPIMSAFSLQNSLKIFKRKENPLNTLNGVRSLCMLWVVFGHQFLFVVQISENTISINNQFQQAYFLLVEAGLFSVDTFFFIGGFLVAYAVLKQPTQSIVKYPLAVLNRWLRLVPAYFVAILFYYSLLIHMGSGPLWNVLEGQVSTCNQMWQSLLFVDNLVDNGATQCMGWGWYLQNDMQIFVYCMFLLLVYQWKSTAGYVMIVWSMLASFYYNMYYTYQNGVHNMTQLEDFGTQAEYQLDIYIKPWARCGPYLFGLLLGIMYVSFLQEEKKEDSDHVFVKLKKRMERSKVLRWSIELSGVLLGCFICFIPRTAQNQHHWAQFAHSLFLAYGKTGFVVAVSLIILPSLLGLNSIFRFILDTKLFNYIGKVSYCTYLLHLSFMSQWIFMQSTNYYLQPIGTYVLFLATSIISIFFGFVLAILVEIPCAKFQKIIMSKLLKKEVRQIVKEKGREGNPEQSQREMKLNESLSPSQEKS